MEASTFAPIVSPVKKLTSRLTRCGVVPIAASECSDPKLPMTAMSAALNSNCMTLDVMSGSANTSIFGKIVPWHISISVDFAMLFFP